MVSQLPAKMVVSGFYNPPALADAWGNPILFVPAGGLKVYTHGSKTSNPAGVVATIVNPVPNRPFWASAGPDGDFATGDDNIYSFEK